MRGDVFVYALARKEAPVKVTFLDGECIPVAFIHEVTELNLVLEVAGTLIQVNRLALKKIERATPPTPAPKPRPERSLDEMLADFRRNR